MKTAFARAMSVVTGPVQRVVAHRRQAREVKRRRIQAMWDIGHAFRALDTLLARPQLVADVRDRIATGYHERPELFDQAFDTMLDEIVEINRILEPRPLPARIVEALPDAIAEEELADRLLVIEPRPAEQMEGCRLTEAETMDAIEAACDSNGEA